jgi:hypothetical protein
MRMWAFPMPVSFCGGGSCSGETSSRMSMVWQLIPDCAVVRGAKQMSRKTVISAEAALFRHNKMGRDSNSVKKSSPQSCSKTLPF